MTMRRIVLGFAALLAAALAGNALGAVSLADLERQAQRMLEREARLWKQREAEYRAQLQQQEQLAEEAVARKNRAEARGKALNIEFDENLARMSELKALLHQHEGNLGELFGVTRQIAGDAAGVLQQSMLTVQFPAVQGEQGRDDFLRRIAAAKALPSIEELQRMWFELFREMTESGKVVRFKAPVTQPDQSIVEMEVVRVGPFTATAEGQYLNYDVSNRALEVLPRQLNAEFRSIAGQLQSAADSGYHKAVVDPARGSLLKLYTGRPNLIERIQHGEVVGYLIVAVGALGVLLALWQYLYLIIMHRAVAVQLRNLANPRPDNPLGRVLIAFRGDGKPVANVDVAELRLSEAVLREVPRLQRFQSFLRLAVAAGPLLGLIGTVIGMIITFHAITAAGSSDPKLMAHGIGQAMIATVLGLGIAIPLLFINSGMTSLSNSVTQVLDEQSQALLARELSERNPSPTGPFGAPGNKAGKK